MKEGEELEIQNREAYEQIFFNSEAKKIFPMARYMIQLEKTRDLAIGFLDEVKSAEYPFIYTDYAKPELAIRSSEMLVDAITAEVAAAEHQFRDALLEIIRDTKNLQKKLFGYEFYDNPMEVCKIVRNIKDYFCSFSRMEDSDEEILEKIIYTIDLDRWLNDFFEKNHCMEEDGDEFNLDDSDLIIEDEDE